VKLVMVGLAASAKASARLHGKSGRSLAETVPGIRSLLTLSRKDVDGREG